MNSRRIVGILAVVLGLGTLCGCGGEKQKMYEQAGKDLEQGSYSYALSGYAACVENGVKLPNSYRGAGIANLRMGNYEEAVKNFGSALECENIGKKLRKDVLLYKVTAEALSGQYEDAMADCQTLAEDFDMDAESYFLTGKVALALDSYDEAAVNFSQAYGEDSTYERAIQIYETYLEHEMEADGTRYLEAALVSEPKSAEDYCNRGLVYYYMQDYEQAGKELIEASNQGSTEALVLLGMVYLAQGDVSNARAMYQEFAAKAEKPARGYNGLALCDIADGELDSALANIAEGISSASVEEMQSLLFNEIVVYEKKLDFGTARAKAKEYVEMYPEDRGAVKELRFLKTRK